MTAIDPIEQNARHAQARGKLKEARFVSVLEMAELAGFADESFDAITALTIHTLGHLPSPSRFVSRIYDLLKPGGYVFLDEKDVLHPVRAIGNTVFDSGAPHYFHFTEDTLQKYFEAAGFVVHECCIDPSRKKALRHVPVVARKPEAPLDWRPGKHDLATDTQVLLKDLSCAQKAMQRRQSVNRFTRGARRQIRKLVN